MFMDKKFRNLLFAYKIQGLKKLLYTNHLCNNGGKIASYDGGTLTQVLLDEWHPQHIVVPYNPGLEKGY